MTKKTKTERVLQHLQNGNEITEAQAQSRFGIANMSAVASTLRFQGFAVYCNRRGDKSFYRLGTPTRSVVAAGYRALAA